MSQVATRTVLYGSLVASVGLALTPTGVHQLPSGFAAPALDEVRLPGTVRDFREAHPDFHVPAIDGYIHVAGNVETTLGADLRPIFAPGGLSVLSEWRDMASHPIAPHLFGVDGGGGCAFVGDVAGVKGAATDGGISSGATFAQWYRDVLGVNLSVARAITLQRQPGGVWTYESDEFFPADGAGWGNEGREHNYFFTYQLHATATYDACTGQFLEFEGGDGSWVFVNGALAVDLGGIDTGIGHHVEFDRLGLADGDTLDVRLFYAQRYAFGSEFKLRTNLDLAPGPLGPTVSASFD